MAKKEIIVEEVVVETPIIEAQVEITPIAQTELLPKQLELGALYQAIKEGQPYDTPNYVLGKIQERILQWNNVRGNFEYDALAEADMYKSEIDEGDLAIALFEEAVSDSDKCKYKCEEIDSWCDRYVFFVGTLAKSALDEAPLSGELVTYYEEFKQIPQIVKDLGFDFVQCMNETLLEIESRKQDPEQVIRWEAQGGSLGEKWQKWREQPEETLYKADYKSSKIGECCK